MEGPNQHTIGLLEIERILDELAGYCVTEGGAAAALDPVYFEDQAEIEASLDRIADWKRILDSEDPLAGLSFPGFLESLPTLHARGAILEGDRLYAIARFVLSTEALRSRLKIAENGERLAALIEVDNGLAAAARKTVGYLDSDGAVIEKAVPELRALGDTMRRIQQNLHKQAQAYLNDERFRSTFAADVPTQKDGRVVLPVRANQRHRLGGVVYDVSQTGSTVYVEPPEILERNNELREIQGAYRAAVTRVYRELTAALHDNQESLHSSVACMTTVDVLYAKARFSRVHECTRPACDAQSVTLQAARHPLLGRACVPMDLTIPHGKRILIITGPNTGGKTVSLKTMGVLALLLRLGMELPVAEQSRLPIFDAVFADIGDEQSLQQSLSTFSGHMKNVGEILRGAGPRSLVLLDELGAGTDPEEGGALAMAVVDRLVELGCTAVITSHHSALKHYGYTHSVVENASVEFDRERLQPTFRLIVGVPGSSHALHIARRHGLPEAAVRSAEHYLGEQRSDASVIIEELSQRSGRLRESEDELRRRRENLEAQQQALRGREQELTERELELKRERQSGFDRFAAESRRRLENLVRELREGELDRERRRQVKDFVADLEAESGRQAEEIEELARRVKRQRSPAVPLVPGARVRVSGSKREGTAVRRVREKQWQVEVGSMRMIVDEDQLEVVGAAEQNQRQPEVDIDISDGGPAPRFELDVRGMRLEEALTALRDQIERATRSGLTDFSVIHGMGTGVLQQGVRSVLAEHRNIEFDYARPEDGGYGKTVVHLNLG